MKLSFHGAAREVTGSCYLLETGRTKILVDCGMFQGGAFADAKNFKDFGFDPKTINTVIVTHSHLDHVGRLPKLCKEGFQGIIYATPPTAKLIKIVLEDAEQIMEDDYQREYRPKLYELKDVEAVISRLKTLDYEKRQKLDGLSFCYREAGHILGSAFVEIEEGGGGARLGFSGDLGNIPNKILKPTAELGAQDVLIVESTYGNRLHEETEDRTKQLHEYIEATVKRGGVLVIPAFAIERTQEILYEMNNLVENKLIPPVEIFLDSPMAIKTSEVMREYPQYYNRDALRQVSTGDDLFVFPGLHKTMSREDSKSINQAPWPKIIIAGSGMMNGGRILHHLVRYLPDPKCSVLIVGYQSSGTLGRALYSGEKNVQVLDERINVKANILSIGAYSAHADQKQILSWIQSAKKPPGLICCTHGEEAASAALASRIKEDLGIKTDVPRFEQIINL